MGALFSRRVGTDPYYLSYEKSFEKIDRKEQQIKERRQKRDRWVSTWKSYGYISGLVWAVIAAILWAKFKDALTPYSGLWWKAVILTWVPPLVMGTMPNVLDVFRRVRDNRDTLYLRRLQDSRKKMLKELKDATHYEKTMALLKRFDPDAQPPPRPATPQSHMTPGMTPQGRGSQPGHGNQAVTPASVLARTGNAAAAAAGKALFPVFDTLANAVIGDNPELVDALRRAQAEVDMLRRENNALKFRLAMFEEHRNPTDSTGGSQEPLSIEGSQAPLALPAPPVSDLPDQGSEGSQGAAAAVQGAGEGVGKGSGGKAGAVVGVGVPGKEAAAGKQEGRARDQQRGAQSVRSAA